MSNSSSLVVITGIQPYCKVSRKRYEDKRRPLGTRQKYDC